MEADYSIPCPSCCKHVELTKKQWDEGGVFKCQKCGRSFRLAAHKLPPKNPANGMK